MTNSNHVELRDITKSYGSTTIIQTTNITISQGEFVSILGPSGCGKSTILSMIAGLAFPSSGAIFTNGQQITSPGPDRGMVFQHHALLPWMTAQGNIEFGLKSARPELTATERRAVAAQFLDQVGLAHAASRRPARLSGGMQQRVGLARAFAVDPEILLLDEPFGALDALTRRELQLQLRNVWEANRRTVIMVTHDVDEAILLSDRILVMAQGPESSVIADIEVTLESDTGLLRRKLLGLLEHSPQPKLEPSLQ